MIGAIEWIDRKTISAYNILQHYHKSSSLHNLGGSMATLNAATQALTEKDTTGTGRWVPLSGSLVWFKRPRLDGNEQSEMRQRMLILGHGFGPHKTELATTTELEGCVVSIRVMSEKGEQTRGIPIARLSPEPPPTDFKPGDQVTWINVAELGPLGHPEADRLLMHISASEPNAKLIVQSTTPASPYTDGSDLTEVVYAENLIFAVPSKFLRRASF